MNRRMGNYTKFITNRNGHDLRDRFNKLAKGIKFFDCLVGYFYITGFHSMYRSLESSKKIRILVGIATDEKTFYLSQIARQQKLIPSIKETEKECENRLIEDLGHSKDSRSVEEGVLKFIEWIKSEKLQIKVYPKEKIHSKLYIMTSGEEEGFGDKGRVITGSSNFTKSGLVDNLEFNVELRDDADYEYASNEFNKLWEDSIDISEMYVQTINEKTWLNDKITPYEMFLKFLYEYLKDKIQLDQEEIENDTKPENFIELEYQKDAVRDAKTKLEEHGGVFISDVVGLGKTFMATMLAKQLKGETLVIAPPLLIDENNMGSWRNVFYEFNARGKFRSLGKLDQILEEDIGRFQNIILDEAHRFRTDTTQTYEQLYKICKGKKIILVTATPLNNTPNDILSLIKLFQNHRNSTLPDPRVRNLENYFKSLEFKLKELDRKDHKEEYLSIVKENAEDIREKVLKHLMVRRTRAIIEENYGSDLKKQGLIFPKIKDPKAVVYNFLGEVGSAFDKTLKMIVEDINYSRYTPLLYFKEKIPENQKTPQKNMGKWMKILLLKRLESSFFAFKESIRRFIKSYDQFLKEYEKGNVFINRKYGSRLFEFIENDDDEAIYRLIERGKIEKLPSSKFKEEFGRDLRSDIATLRKIDAIWSKIDTDPKVEKLIEELREDENLKENKIIIFTESKETAEYLKSKLDPLFNEEVLYYSSKVSKSERKNVIDNFDPSSKNQKNDFRILVTTEILSEGVSLNRSNIVINYDIPWNPTRMMQRVGRINRVGKNLLFEEIYTYNFFPATHINDEINLTESAEIKIKLFIELLGNDAKLLTDEEIKSHDLFKRLNSKETLLGEDEKNDPELKWLLELRKIRDEQPELFDKIKNLPKKARTATKKEKEEGLFTFFKRGKLRKLYYNKNGEIKELDFVNASKLLESPKEKRKEKVNKNFYSLLDENKKQFDDFFLKDNDQYQISSTGNEAKLRKIIKAILKKPVGLTDDDEEYLRKTLNIIKEGSVPKKTLKKINENIKNAEPPKIVSKIKEIIPENSELFKKTYVDQIGNFKDTKETILSEMFLK